MDLLGRLFCKNCNGYYELQPGESPTDFECCSECGGSLEYIEDDVDKGKKNSAPSKTKIDNNKYVRDSISTGKTYTEKKAAQYQEKASQYPKNRVSRRKSAKNKRKSEIKSIILTSTEKNHTVIQIGAVIILAGIIGIIFFSVLALFLIPLGLIIIVYAPSKTQEEKYQVLQESYRPYKHRNPLRTPPIKTYKSPSDGKSWVKGLEGENMVLKYLNTLPKNYFVFHDVTLPDKKGNIDHIVIGPSGLFVIETKNYTGKYRIDGNKWYYYKDGDYKEINYDPGSQLIINVLDLKRFLETKGIAPTELYANAIVAFIEENFIFTEEPKTYKVLTAQMIPNYILHQKRKEKLEILLKAAQELEPHCTELTFVRKKDQNE